MKTKEKHYGIYTNSSSHIKEQEMQIILNKNKEDS